MKPEELKPYAGSQAAAASTTPAGAAPGSKRHD